MPAVEDGDVVPCHVFDSRDTCIQRENPDVYGERKKRGVRRICAHSPPYRASLWESSRAATA
eukprot:2146735-Prymnesium_polylepis.1